MGWLLFAGMFCTALYGAPELVEIESGTAVFHSPTNVPGVEVTGKSTAIAGRVEVKENESGLQVERIEASVPVKSLATGMKVRDEHMRKWIFTDAEGQQPDLHFTAGEATCQRAGNSRDLTCRIAGDLSIRGAARPFHIDLNVKEQPAQALRASGDGVVKLSDYGIPQPSQFGVKSLDEVKLHLEFTAKIRGGGQ